MTHARLTYFLFFTLFSIFFLSSCTTNSYEFYKQVGPQNTTVNEKSDFKMASSFSNVQVGYSPIKNIGLQGSYYKAYLFGLENIIARKNPEDFEDTRISMWDGAFGGYYSFPLHIEDSELLLDFYSGFGKGKLAHYHNRNTFLKFDFQKIYQQFGIHFNTPRAEISYFLKREDVIYKNGLIQGFYYKNLLDKANRLIDPTSFIFYSSTLKATLNLQSTQLFISYISALKKSNNDFLPNDSVQVGFTIDFHKRRTYRE